MTEAIKSEDCYFLAGAMTNLDSVLQSRDITLLTKVCIVKAMVFPLVTYSFDSWMVQKAEGQRINTFELWCWRRILRVPWTVRRSNKSILKEINPEYSLEGLMLKLKLQYFGHLMWTTDSLEKSLMLGNIEKEKVEKKQKQGEKKQKQKEKRASEDEMVVWHHQWNGHELGQILGDGKGQGGWCTAVHGVAKSRK